MKDAKMIIAGALLGVGLLAHPALDSAPQPLEATARIAMAIQQAGDTMLVDGVFTMAPDDGRGVGDSVRVRLIGVPDQAQTWIPAPLPNAATAFAFVHVFAPAAGSASYTIGAEVVAWRRGAVGVALSPTVEVTISDAPMAPPGVSPLVVRVP